MSKEFLCKCNECGLVMFDENPSDNAIKVEIDTLPEPPSNLEQIYDEFGKCELSEDDFGMDNILYIISEIK